MLGCKKEEARLASENYHGMESISLFDPKAIDKMVNKLAEIKAQNEPKTTTQDKVHAYEFLEHAVKEMKDRATQRDNGSNGERSMAATVKAFNALTGFNLSEENGWEFMILLKLVRGRQGNFRMDDYTDAAAYSGLLGECASATRGAAKTETMKSCGGSCNSELIEISKHTAGYAGSCGCK